MDWKELFRKIEKGDVKSLARGISLIENEVEGYEELLQLIPNRTDAKIIGITGPPGAGKSTLVDAFIRLLMTRELKVAVLCVDPSSAFNLGALLGDRIRMREWYNNPHVFIRSLATRGSLGGLHPKIIEMADLLKAAAFDYIIIETVGVGQSEIEIAGLADTTVVVLVPEAGDEVQTMKAGLMEIADIFVVNKSDRPDADLFAKNLKLMLAPAFHHKKTSPPVIKTIASTNTGIEELLSNITAQLEAGNNNHKRAWLLAEKAYQLIQSQRMKNVSKADLEKAIKTMDSDFNLYRFVKKYEEKGKA